MLRAMDAGFLEQARERGKVAGASYRGRDYLRFSDQVQQVPRGTAVFDGNAIWGYPQIGRIVTLAGGLREHFAGPFHMEEKIDGYNVRVFRQGDQVLALTRGGYVCPFTTDRIADLMDTAIFDERPELVVCAEVAGPGNPYLPGSPAFAGDDVEAYVFDLMHRDRPGFVPHEEKRRLLARYRLPAVRDCGVFDHGALPAIRKIVAGLNEDGREGVVFKEDGPRAHRAKYITSNAAIADIRLSMPNLREMPAEFFTNRVLLLAAFLEEEGADSGGDMEVRLGGALLEGLFQAIAQYRRVRHVYDRHRCRFRHEANARLMIEFLGRRTKEMQIIQRRLEREGEFYVLEYDKVYPGMTGLIAHLLGGGLLFD